jgi:hypothetical protein
VSAANAMSVISFCFSNLSLWSMVKDTHLDISETHCSMQLKKSLNILDFSLKPSEDEENCTLCLPWESGHKGHWYNKGKKLCCCMFCLHDAYITVHRCAKCDTRLCVYPCSENCYTKLNLHISQVDTCPPMHMHAF